MREFSGESAKEIVDELFIESKAGLPDLTYESWWDYQISILSDHGVPHPQPHDDNAEERLLAALVQLGALEYGPKVPAQFPAPGMR